MTLVYGFIVKKQSGELFESGCLFFKIDELMASVGSALERARDCKMLVKVKITVDDV